MTGTSNVSNDRISEIYEDVKSITTKQLPEIEQHLARLNGTVREHSDDITELQGRFTGLPCADNTHTMTVLSEAVKHLTEKLGEDRGEMEKWIDRLITLGQALLTAWLLSKLL